MDGDEEVKNATPPGGYVFQHTGIILELIQYIIRMNLPAKKNSPPPGGYVFQPTGIIFILFHKHWTIHVTSRVITRKNAPPLGSQVFQTNVIILKIIQYIIETNLWVLNNNYGKFHGSADDTVLIFSLTVVGDLRLEVVFLREDH
ncbi:hypothetical protein DPMN_100045 [Dreissena polymorpha]|uniref:Uncharacterized protein n=1 Tax=Dreissena polymorpha TaxID=45954 RepID=A0A9D4LF72_DREPO|nr:hypothetical protein DPMN_100045 [Dreissena polymorpha]